MRVPFAFIKAAGGGAAAPTVSSVNKSGITRIQGGILFTITGTDFTDATEAAFGGTAGTSLNVVNDTTIEVVTPAKSAGTYDVTVTGPGGTGTLTNGIKYVSPTSIFGGDLQRHYSQSYAAGVWTDESGGGNTSQATAGKRPSASTFAGTTDRPATHVALLFDGTDDGLSMATATDLITTTGCVACIFTADPTPAEDDGNLVAKDYNVSEVILASTRTGLVNKACFGCGGASTTELAVSAASVNDDAVRRVIGTLGASTSRLYVDGALEADTGTGAPATGSGDVYAVGCAMQDEATTAYHHKGKIGEVVIADVTPSADQRAELDAYLRDCAGQAA